MVECRRVGTGEPLTIDCEVVACCDGAASAFCAGADDFAVAYSFRWLTLIAEPCRRRIHGTIYGLHRRGFAGQMHRSPTVSRFMLEVPAGDGFDTWPDDRIWAELQQRLAASGRPPIEPGEILVRDVLDHRVRVCDPMQDGRLFYAGDAAHLITPAGGKGMNMAIQDAVELAGGLCDRYGEPNDGRRLERYSEMRLPRIWRHQEFSNLMLSMFNAGAGSGGSPGHHGLFVRPAPSAPRSDRQRPTVLALVRQRVCRYRLSASDYKVSSRVRKRSRR